MDKLGERINLEEMEIKFENISQDVRSYFQLKWDEIIDITGEDPHTMWIYGLLIYTMAYYWLYGAFFTFMDVTGRPKFLRKYKVQPGTNEPVETGKLLNAIFVVICNQIFVAGPLAYITFKYVVDCNEMPRIRELPSLFRFVTDILACVALFEIFFYYAHRFLHIKYVYKRVHKKHHEWTSPIAITTEYCHPGEHMLTNLLPVSIGVIIMKSHYLTALIWFSFVSSVVMSYHSGYCMPLLFNPESHDFHHIKFNYCYGAIGVLDKLHGTDSLFRKFKAEKRQKAKKQN